MVLADVPLCRKLILFTKCFGSFTFWQLDAVSLPGGGKPRPSALPQLRLAVYSGSAVVVLYRANGRGGFGSQTAADPSGDPPKVPKKQTVGTVTASHEMLSLQALSSSLNAGTAKRGFWGQGKAFGCPPAVCPQNGRVHLLGVELFLVTVKCRGGGGWVFQREWIMHLELGRTGTTVPHLYPQEVWRYHGRYDGTTPVPSGGTTVPPLYPEVVVGL